MPTLKINKNLNNELNRTLRNFNQKVARLQKLDQYNVLILPNKQSKKDLLNNITSKRELTRKIKELKRFTQRGSERLVEIKTGETFAKWELDIYKIERQRALRYYNKRIKKLESEQPKASGKNVGVTYAQMGDPTYITALRNKQKILNARTPERKEYKKTLEYFMRKSEDRSRILKENYMSGLLTLGYQSGVSQEIIQKIHDRLLELTDKEFLNIFNNDLTVSKIMNNYRVYRKNISKGYDLFKENWDDIDNDFLELFRNLDNIIGEV